MQVLADGVGQVCTEEIKVRRCEWDTKVSTMEIVPGCQPVEKEVGFCTWNKFRAGVNFPLSASPNSPETTWQKLPRLFLDARWQRDPSQHQPTHRLFSHRAKQDKDKTVGYSIFRDNISQKSSALFPYVSQQNEAAVFCILPGDQTASEAAFCSDRTHWGLDSVIQGKPGSSWDQPYCWLFCKTSFSPSHPYWWAP